MLPPVYAQFPATRFLKELERCLARLSHLSQHVFLSADQGWIEGNWRFSTDNARFDQPHREMESLPQGKVLGRLFNYAPGRTNDALFYQYEVNHQFGGGPFRCAWFGGPLLARHAFRGAQKCQAGMIEFRDEGREVQEASLLLNLRRWRRRLVQRREPVAVLVLRQKRGRSSAGRQAAYRRSVRRAQRFQVGPRAIL